MVVNTYLNVTSVDPQVVEGVAEFSTELSLEIANYSSEGWGALDIISFLGEMLESLIEIIADALTKDPVFLGFNEMSYSAVDFQKMLKHGKKSTKVLEFMNDDVTGSYKLNTTTSRK